MLQQLYPDLWICPVPYRAMGMPIGRQLVVVRLAGGGLWVHSPIPVTPALRGELAALGGIRHVVGPNCYHDECLVEFQREYPAAELHAAPGLAKQRPDIRFGAELSDVPHPEWAGALEQHLIKGMPKLNEVVFFHAASRSLIIADIAFNLGPDGPWWFAMLMRFNGCWGRFGPTQFCKSNMRDKGSVRASLDRILAWDFDRVIVGHGKNLETGGKETFRQAFAFLA